MHTEQEISVTMQELKKVHQQQIERIVCSGGGAKGVVYGGSYKAMKDTGILKGVQEFAGASAGAITAAFMATGMPPNTLCERLLTTNLKKLMGNSIGVMFGKNPPGVSFITTDGKPLEQFIRENIVFAVKNSLSEIDGLEMAKQDPDFLKLLIKLNDALPRITFGDLALLNRYFPETFKKLTMPAVKFPNGELQIFNSELTPDVEISIACRASSSIPVVLQPVEIEINGVKHKFVDGGLYDNLPTDYFDKKEKGEFLPNQKPNQTLVFAFGEGLNDKKSPVFQALYGRRWDEIITTELLNKILGNALARCKKIFELGEKTGSPKEQADLIIHAVKIVLNELKKYRQITADEAKVMLNIMNKTIHHLLLKPKENQHFWKAYKQEKNAVNRLELLSEFIKHKMVPILYQAGFVEQLKREVLIEIFGGIKTPYKNMAKKEEGYQKLRSQYALRTVELRVGEIKTTDFDQATRVARVMGSLGYLDTINHITNHELHDPKVFYANQFYVDIVDKFEKIYQATLLSSGKDPQKNLFFRDINLLKKQLKARRENISEAEISRQVYQLIKDRVEPRLDSVEAFALSRAVEYQNKTLNAEQLFKETYEEGFKRSGFFSVSNITGEHVFKSSTLHQLLKDKNMFDLYAKQRVHQVPTRTDKVFESLSKITSFHQEHQSWDEFSHHIDIGLSP